MPVLAARVISVLQVAHVLVVEAVVAQAVTLMNRSIIQGIVVALQVCMLVLAVQVIFVRLVAHVQVVVVIVVQVAIRMNQ